MNYLISDATFVGPYTIETTFSGNNCTQTITETTTVINLDKYDTDAKEKSN